eukprot:TRINITY_DN96131_c0_g1_i1.p1 TRINITY_DN96131_c0_g1~~TRINITY_DN96131_c0_g1_i1.p1  ORF type:complete len:248 (+),score=27.31 TRINITY_DN96131_c0_g1_i1:73-816(+)
MTQYAPLTEPRQSSGSTLNSEWEVMLADRKAAVDKVKSSAGGFCGPGKVDEAMLSTRQGELAVAARIDEIPDITPGDKMWLMGGFTFRESCYETADTLHKRALFLDTLFGICAALVPILIPFSQTYKETVFQFFGVHVNIGTLISIIAVLCSLVGTTVQVYMRTSKTSELCALWSWHAGALGFGYDKYLGKAGDYAGLASQESFRMFCSRFTAIREEAFQRYADMLPGQHLKKDMKKSKDGDSAEPA